MGGPVCPSVRISVTSSLIQRLKWTLESIGFFSTFGCGDLDGQFGEGRGGRAGRPFHRQILEYRFMNFNFEKRRNASALDRQQREVPREGDKGELDQEGGRKRGAHRPHVTPFLRDPSDPSPEL